MDGVASGTWTTAMVELAVFRPCIAAE